MKRLVVLSVILSIALIPSCPFPTLAQEDASLTKLNSVSFKGGLYIPKSDLDEFDNGFYTDVMFTRYLNKFIALETGIGFYGARATYNGVLPVWGSYTEEDDIGATPIKFNLKVIFPFSQGEFYVGAGIGLYFAYAEAEVTSTGLGSFYLDDSDVVFGGQFKAGLIFNLNQHFFLGIEGEYMITDTAEFSSYIFGVPATIETDLNGYAINGVFGFRF